MPRGGNGCKKASYCTNCRVNEARELYLLDKGVSGRPKARHALLGGLALSVATIIGCLIVGEVAIRAVHPSASLWHYPNFIKLATKPDPNHEVLMRYDRVLGYEPRPNSSGMSGGERASFSADGFRNQNLAAPVTGGPLILAVGDSFTEGWAAKDDETWPAHLERDLHQRVLNAGVRSYGLDQIVLRAERLLPSLVSPTVVLGFIEEDIVRTALAARLSVSKPYFAPVNDGIELRNVPVPPIPYAGPFDVVRRVLGYSYLLDFVMRRLGATDLWYGNTLETGFDPDLVSCRLMQRFAVLIRSQKAKAMVVALPEYQSWNDPLVESQHRKRLTDALLCASRVGLATLDARDGFIAAGVGKDPDAYYINWHFNDRGNAVAARLIASALAAGDKK